jgi:hypothetical protein
MMNKVDVGELLREADPLAREEGLSPADANRLRRGIVDATREPSTDAPGWWPNPVVVAATVAVTLMTGAVVARLLPARDRSIDAIRVTASPSAAAARERRQLQFATPGGTRIIWVFDSDFNP